MHLFFSQPPLKFKDEVVDVVVDEYLAGVSHQRKHFKAPQLTIVKLKVEV